MLEQFKKSLKVIENKENYYANFWAVMEHCVLAFYLKNKLWGSGVIGDNELHYYTERIQLARKEAIQTHKEYTIEVLKENEERHTIESVVSSVYADVYHL